MGPRLRRFVGAPKADIKLGAWHSGKVPKKDFPMAKQAYGLGSSFRWRVISFVALGVECRVLVILNLAKEKYEAILGAMGLDALHVLCSYEYHAGEPGWHCHAACDDLASVPLGYMRGPWVRRLPAASGLIHAKISESLRRNCGTALRARLLQNRDARHTDMKAAICKAFCDEIALRKCQLGLQSARPFVALTATP